MFLLTSFAVLTPAQAENDEKTTLKSILVIDNQGTKKFIDDDEQPGEEWPKGTYDYKYENNVAKITLHKGNYERDGKLIEVKGKQLELTIDGDFSVDFKIEGEHDLPITSKDDIIILGNGKLTMKGLDGRPSISIDDPQTLTIGTATEVSTNVTETSGPTISSDGPLVSKGKIILNSGIVEITGNGQKDTIGLYSPEFDVNGGRLYISNMDNGLSFAGDPFALYQNGGFVSILNCNTCVEEHGKVSLSASGSSDCPLIYLNAKKGKCSNPIDVKGELTKYGSTNGEDWKEDMDIKDASYYIVGAETDFTAEPNDSNLGSVEKTCYEKMPKDKFFLNETVELKAVPKEGCDFVSWTDGCKDKNRTVTVGADNHYIATFQSSDPHGPCISLTAENGYADTEIYDNTMRITVTFDNGAMIDITLSPQSPLKGHHIYFYLMEAVGSDGLYTVEVTLDDEHEPIENTDMVVTLPYNTHKGEPAVYEYPDPHDLDIKNDMKAYVDEHAKKVSFTINHSGLYGIEYTETASSANISNVILLIVIITAILVAIALTIRTE